MSGSRSTGELVARLTERLEPVRPVPPLHRQVLAVAGVWALSAAVAAGWLGLHPLAVLERGTVSTTFAWVFALVGFAGLTLGLACLIPGRERVARAAAAGVALGVSIVVGVGLLLPGSVTETGSLAQCMDCVGTSLLFAGPPGLAALWLALRGAAWRSRAAGFGLAIGATSLGAFLVHLSCLSPSAWHWLVAHAVLPLASGVPAGFLLAWVLQRAAARSRFRASER